MPLKCIDLRHDGTRRPCPLRAGELVGVGGGRLPPLVRPAARRAQRRRVLELLVIKLLPTGDMHSIPFPLHHVRIRLLEKRVLLGSPPARGLPALRKISSESDHRVESILRQLIRSYRP